MGNITSESIISDLRYLQLLSHSFPTIADASTEIINLEAILNLPKGTEHFLTDIHGEYEAFQHVLKNASGAVKRKVNEIFGHTLRESEKKELCTLIYYPEEKLQLIKASEKDVRPHTYVCDEPTANLDSEGAARLADILRKLKDEGNTLIIAEHRLAWLSGIVDRFVYVSEGTIQWEKTPAQMRELSDEERKRYGLREIAETEISLPMLPASAGEEHLFCRNLTCRRKKAIIFENLNFALPAGLITAVTGKNGAGKTTLAMALTGLQKPGSGEVYIGGKSLSAGKRRKAVWYSSNDTGTQFFTTSVTDELLLHSDASPGRLERARALLKTLGLYAYKDAHPAALSGGQKQRLSIACGLLSGREILLLDEPTSGLDGGNMRKIAAVLTEAAAEGKTILVITHDKELMQSCCNFQWELCQ